jgi:hypothetical protein
VNVRTFRKLCDQIAWSQHGGSGFSFTRADMLDMSVGDLVHHAKSANAHREKEADAIRQAHQGSTTTRTKSPW